jgi:hypothetical protein
VDACEEPPCDCICENHPPFLPRGCYDSLGLDRCEVGDDCEEVCQL